VTYDRLLQVSDILGNLITDNFDVDIGVSPLALQHGLFTTAAVDNLDHNPSSASAVHAFHGTAISLTQHWDCSSEHSDLTNNLGDFSRQCKTLKILPTSYTEVTPVTVLNKDFTLSQSDVFVTADCGQFANEMIVEYRWLQKVSFSSSTDDVDDDDSGNTFNSLEMLDLSWAAYHVSLPLQVPSFTSRSGLLPMFRDPAHSPATICHAMAIVTSAVETVNPGQTPVLALDQPLYSLIKILVELA
jgi:hypothetical protein